ncbi:MAG: hypothetical protein ACRDQ4_10685 [Pseudonocardiaceae bacterium]
MRDIAGQRRTVVMAQLDAAGGPGLFQAPGRRVERVVRLGEQRHHQVQLRVRQPGQPVLRCAGTDVTHAGRALHCTLAVLHRKTG